MKLKDVMLRATAKPITGFQAAEIRSISCRHMQRWKTRFKLDGYEGLFDRRRGIPSPNWVPLKIVEEVLRLYQEQYFAFNVRLFHERLSGVVRSSMTRCGHEATERSRSGAGDETTGRHVAGDGQADHLVSGSGDPRD